MVTLSAARNVWSPLGAERDDVAKVRIQFLAARQAPRPARATLLPRRLTQNPAGFTMQWMHRWWTVRGFVRDSPLSQLVLCLRRVGLVSGRAPLRRRVGQRHGEELVA